MLEPTGKDAWLVFFDVKKLVLAGVLSVASFFASFRNRPDVVDYAAPVKWLIEMCDQHLFWLSIIVFGLLCVSHLGAWWRRRKGLAVLWLVLQRHLDGLQKVGFPNHQQENPERHRVTLFRRKRWCFRSPLPKGDRCCGFPWGKGRWPWSGWLVPVLRSGDRGKISKTAFFAPLNDSDRAEGVAGRCWSNKATEKQVGLPEAKKNGSAAEFEAYSARTGMPVWMVKQYADNDRRLPRAILSYPVHTESGDLWGVLVFDSQRGDSIDDQKAWSAFDAVTAPLATLLKELS